MDEVKWLGAKLRIGDAIVPLDSLRQRCPMTTVDPDTRDRDRDVLREIMSRFDGRLALNAGIIRPGAIHVSDEVVLALSDGEVNAH